MEHGLLDLTRKDRQVRGQPIEHFPFRWVRSEVSDQGAFGCVRAKLFQMGLKILHGLPALFPHLAIVVGRSTTGTPPFGLVNEK
jgi:hypothetical protein